MSSIIKNILEYAEETYGENINKLIDEIKRRECFEHLVLTIISQNTNWRNVRKAAENLKKILGTITPYTILYANIDDLERALKPAGLYKVKSRWLKSIAYTVVEKFGGSLDYLKELPLDKARETLLRIPGIGFKTADIILCFCFSKPILPIDTHIKRIAKRTGTCVSKNYDEIRIKLEREIRPEARLKAHLLLISFGRNICRARNPLCKKCPVNSVCPSSIIGK